MNHSFLITGYTMDKICRQHIYSAGPDAFFDRPCIGYIKKGYAQFLYEGKTLYAHEGDLIYISYGTKYHSVWFGSPDIEWYSVVFEYASPYAFSDYRFQILPDYPAELLECMYQTFACAPLQSISHFYRLLDDIYQKLKSTPKAPPYLAVEPAICYIEQNYQKPIAIHTLASLCHCSESGFFKLFSKATGTTPIAYKHNVMIQHALELLAHSNLSIEQISTELGFSSSNYFRTVFTRLTGKSPRQLRSE